jgi:hypothetical protein
MIETVTKTVILVRFEDKVFLGCDAVILGY